MFSSFQSLAFLVCLSMFSDLVSAGHRNPLSAGYVHTETRGITVHWPVLAKGILTRQHTQRFKSLILRNSMELAILCSKKGLGR